MTICFTCLFSLHIMVLNILKLVTLLPSSRKSVYEKNKKVHSICKKQCRIKCFPLQGKKPQVMTKHETEKPFQNMIPIYI